MQAGPLEAIEAFLRCKTNDEAYEWLLERSAWSACADVELCKASGLPNAVQLHVGWDCPDKSELPAEYSSYRKPGTRKSLFGRKETAVWAKAKRVLRGPGCCQCHACKSAKTCCSAGSRCKKAALKLLVTDPELAPQRSEAQALDGAAAAVGAAQAAPAQAAARGAAAAAPAERALSVSYLTNGSTQRSASMARTSVSASQSSVRWSAMRSSQGTFSSGDTGNARARGGGVAKRRRKSRNEARAASARHVAPLRGPSREAPRACSSSARQPTAPPTTRRQPRRAATQRPRHRNDLGDYVLGDESTGL